MENVIVYHLPEWGISAELVKHNAPTLKMLLAKDGKMWELTYKMDGKTSDGFPRFFESVSDRKLVTNFTGRYEE